MTYKQIPEFSRYEINECGDVRIIETKKELTHTLLKGYHKVTLVDDTGILRCKTLHRLVLQVFNPIKDDYKMIVIHRDKDKNNNTLTNLEWAPLNTKSKENTKKNKDKRVYEEYVAGTTKRQLCKEYCIPIRRVTYIVKMGELGEYN